MQSTQSILGSNSAPHAEAEAGTFGMSSRCMGEGSEARCSQMHVSPKQVDCTVQRYVNVCDQVNPLTCVCGQWGRDHLTVMAHLKRDVHKQSGDGECAARSQVNTQGVQRAQAVRGGQKERDLGAAQV